MEQGRLFKIVYHLLDKGRATAPELAEKFEVSVRTIYRDLDAISAAGIPIYTVQGKGGGIFILPEFVLEKSLLTPQEKEQILMALQGLAAAEDSRTDELLTKLGGLFRVQGANWIEVDFSDWHKNTAAVRRAQKGCFQLPQGQLFVFCGRRRRHCPHGGTGQADFQEQGLVFVRLLPFAKRLPLF
jgi:predicted DNA-binding transcriptional regulator YafY